VKVNKIGMIHRCVGNCYWWSSHDMAPTAMKYNDNILRVFVGCWDSNKVSRIGYVDVDINNPNMVLNVSDKPILDIGRDGCFDENGVFPSHVYTREDGTVLLFYTGFQLGYKIRHYNFGGLAISKDYGKSFERYSQAPLLDRADEGLFVRAGQSIEKDYVNGGYHVIYGAGSSWCMCKGEYRPVYDVFYQHSEDGITLKDSGERIISCDLSIEHGLGRPQIIKLGGCFYCFYTRRIIKDMKYFIGVSRSLDCKKWERIDWVFDDVEYGKDGEFDNEMIYFPSVVKVSENKAFLFYSGNYYGRDGMGVMELEF